MREKLRALREAAAARSGRLVILGHDVPDVDSVVSCVLMQRLMAYLGEDAQVLLPTRADVQARRVLAGYGVDCDAMRGQTNAQDALMLVDHYAARHPGNVIAVVDHHPTQQQIAGRFVWNAQRGACAAMVLDLMEASGMDIETRDREMAVAALYLDTMALRSSKITAQEAAYAEREALRLGMDVQALTYEGLGLMDMSRPVQELVEIGRKEYDFGGRKVISSYVQTDEMTQETLCALLEQAQARRRESGAQLWVLLHHDPVAMRSCEYHVTQGGVAQMQHDRLISRGRDVMPRIERTMMNGETDDGLSV